MVSYQLYICTVTVLLAFIFAFPFASTTRTPQLETTHRTVVVDPTGKGDFKTIQSAINSVPSNNARWVCISLKPGVYREQITIPREKPYIYLKGENQRNTIVSFGGHENLAKSVTFTSVAENIVAHDITFVNSYNFPPNENHNPRKPAAAASIQGDKSAFYRCGFIGVQDTLWDAQGRHYFKDCSIHGSVDFIFGAGQSIYEGCQISVVGEALNGIPGYITAQGRASDRESNGFVFKMCKISGNGKAYLGRPWRKNARVLFYDTAMTDVVVPHGWDNFKFNEAELTFSEYNSQGPGAGTSQRVKWQKKLDEATLKKLTSISFIDDSAWLKTLPSNIFANDSPENNFVY